MHILVENMAESLARDVFSPCGAASVSVFCVGCGLDMTMTTKIWRNLKPECREYVLMIGRTL